MSIFRKEEIKRLCKEAGVKIDVDKDIVVDFSKASYKVEEKKGRTGKYLLLTPDNTDFLSEVTKLFPLSAYDIKIIQSIGKHRTKQRALIHLDIKAKSGKNLFMLENAVLSDVDYSYLKDVYESTLEGYEWLSASEYLKDEIRQYLKDGESPVVSSEKAYEYLSNILCARYKEFKYDGYVDFDDELIDDTINSIIENVLKEYWESIDNPWACTEKYMK